jgi:hypothetical protein
VVWALFEVSIAEGLCVKERKERWWIHGPCSVAHPQRRNLGRSIIYAERPMES